MGLEQIWSQLYELYGERLAHPDHEPKRFEYQLKLFKYINSNGQKPFNNIPQGKENGI
jgi:hypothetical protein